MPSETTIIQLLLYSIPVGKGDGAIGQMPLSDDICGDNPSVADLYLLAKVTVPLDKCL
jgi:hypothetical protein